MLFIKYCRSWPVAPNFATNTWYRFAGIDFAIDPLLGGKLLLRVVSPSGDWSKGLVGSHSHVTTIASRKRLFEQL